MPTDEADRRVAINEHSWNIFVEAGAGTGKTTLLVARLVAMLAEGTSMRSIAAITFTEKAAAELRDRLRAALTMAGLTDQLAELDDATITTIHGFARAILSAHALAAELPPRFAIMGDVEAGLDFERRFRLFADDLLTGGGPHDIALRSLLVQELGRNRLGALAWTLQDQRHRLDGIEWPEPPLYGDASDAVEALRKAVAMRSGCLDDQDRLVWHLNVLADVVELLVASDDPVEQRRLLLTATIASKNKGRAHVWGHPYSKQDVVNALADGQNVADQFLAQSGHHVVASLVPELARFVIESGKARRLGGTLQFHDLLVEARRLLRDNPHVRASVAERWPFVLVDEFQDTDQLQLDLIALVTCTDTDAGELRWNERSLAAGGLFAVGDPKQSIYRFRGAEMGLYQEAADAFANRKATLIQNFRSVPGVLQWVNAVMGKLFSNHPDVQARYRDLVPSRRGNRGVAVELLGPEVLPHDSATVRLIEADDVAAAVVRLKAQQLQIEDRSLKRAVRFGDMAILLPTRLALPALEAALEAVSVPFRVESRSLVYATSEVRTIANVLRAIDDPGDAIAVVGALRSYAFACSDADFVSWRQLGGRWHPFAEYDIPPDHPVALALRELAELHEQRWWTSLDAMVQAIIDRCELRSVALAHRRPRDRWRRLQLVIDQAMAFEAVGGRHLRAFVEWLDAQRDATVGDSETVVPDADDDAVRVMTVHAAKGLEFPVVILAGLGSPDRIPQVPVLWSNDGLPLVRIGRRALKIEHPGYQDAVGLHRSLESAEEERLLYVAATRARDRLLVCLHRSARLSAATRLHSIVQQEPLLWRLHQPELAFGLGESSRPLGLSTMSATSASSVDVVEWNARHARAIMSPRERTMSATALAAARRDEEEPRPPWRRGRAGTSIGRAVHAVLQSIDLVTGEGSEASSELQASAEGISMLRPEVVALVRNVLAAPIVVEAGSCRHWREVFVATTLGDTLVEGFIDLLFERPDGSLVIVDYKTDSVRTEAQIDTAFERYRLQGAAYAAAVSAQLSKPVSEVVFVFARAPAITRSVTDVDAAIGEVMDLLGQGAQLADGGRDPIGMTEQ